MRFFDGQGISGMSPVAIRFDNPKMKQEFIPEPVLVYSVVRMILDKKFFDYMKTA